MKSKNSVTAYLLQTPLLFLAVTFFFVGCLNAHLKTDEEITFINSRGRNPSASRIIWSPTDEDKVLVTAYQSPMEPSEVYILDIKTKQKIVLAKEMPGYFFDARWTADGKQIMILAENNTKGFEPSGWWVMDVNNKSPEYLLNSVDAAWSADGKTVGVLREEKNDTNTIKIDLLLFNLDTNSEDFIATYNEVDSSWGLSWSSDDQYLAFSLGKIRSSNLYVLDAKSLQITQITNNNGSKHPAWSPTGNIIAYERNSPNNIAESYLYLVSSDGRCAIEIPNLGIAWSPTWSPDGKKLGYMSRNGIYYLEIEKVLGRDIYRNLCN